MSKNHTLNISFCEDDNGNLEFRGADIDHWDGRESATSKFTDQQLEQIKKISKNKIDDLSLYKTGMYKDMVKAVRED